MFFSDVWTLSIGRWAVATEGPKVPGFAVLRQASRLTDVIAGAREPSLPV